MRDASGWTPNRWTADLESPPTTFPRSPAPVHSVTEEPTQAADSPAEHPDDAAPAPLPEIPTALPAEEIVRRLDAAARRGRLAGYQTLDAEASKRAGGAIFEVRDFGVPVEGVLRGRLEGGVLRFDAAMQPRLLIIMAVILALCVWPGVWLTESMLASMFPLTTWAWKWTAWWYLPLAIGSAPWVLWTMVSRSRASIDAGARELIEKIEKEIKA